MADFVLEYFQRKPIQKEKHLICFQDPVSGVATVLPSNEDKLNQFLEETPIPIENMKDKVHPLNYIRLYIGSYKENLSPRFSRMVFISSASLIAYLAYMGVTSLDEKSALYLSGKSVPLNKDAFETTGGVLSTVIQGALIPEVMRVAKNNILYSANIALELAALNSVREWIGNYLVTGGQMDEKGLMFNIFTPSTPVYNRVMDKKFLRTYCLGWGQVTACREMDTTLVLMDRVFDGNHRSASTLFSELDKERAALLEKVSLLNSKMWNDVNLPNLVSYGLVAGKTETDAKQALLQWIRGSFDEEALQNYHAAIKIAKSEWDVKKNHPDEDVLRQAAVKEDLADAEGSWFGVNYRSKEKAYDVDVRNKIAEILKLEKKVADLTAASTMTQLKKELSKQFRRIESNILRARDDEKGPFDSDWYAKKSESIQDRIFSLLSQYQVYLPAVLPLFVLSKDTFLKGFSLDAVGTAMKGTSKYLKPVQTYNKAHWLYTLGPKAMEKLYDLVTSYSPTRDPLLNGTLFAAVVGSLVAHTFYGYNNVVYDFQAIFGGHANLSIDDKGLMLMEVSEMAVVVFHNLIVEHGYLGIPFITHYVVHFALLETLNKIYEGLRKAAGCEFRPFRRNLTDKGPDVEWRIALDIKNIMDGPDSELRDIALPKGAGYMLLKNAIKLTDEDYDPNPKLIREMYEETKIEAPSFLDFLNLKRKLPVFKLDEFVKFYSSSLLDIGSKFKWIYLENTSGKSLADIPSEYKIKHTTDNTFFWVPKAIVLKGDTNIRPSILAMDPKVNINMHIPMDEDKPLKWYRLDYSIEEIATTPFMNSQYQYTAFSGILLELVSESTHLGALLRNSMVDFSELNRELGKISGGYKVTHESKRSHDNSDRICEFEATLRMLNGRMLNPQDTKKELAKMRAEVYTYLLSKEKVPDRIRSSFLKSWMRSDTIRKDEDAMLPKVCHELRLEAIAAVIGRKLRIVGLELGELEGGGLMTSLDKTYGSGLGDPVTIAAYQVPTVVGHSRWHYYNIEYVKKDF